VNLDILITALSTRVYNTHFKESKTFLVVPMRTNLDDELLNQFRCPTGEQGRAIAARMNKGHDQLTSWGLSHVKIGSDFVVLDIGVGGGKTVGKLANYVSQGKVFGIDVSKEMVEYSKNENRQLAAEGKISLLQGTAQNLSFPNGFFDLVTAVETCYFWPSLPEAFKEINRVLKPDGKLLIISEMIKDGKYEVENAEMIEKVHVKLFSIQELQGMLEDAGLTVEFFRKPCSPWNAIVAQKPMWK
jgi:ubiquinone/menaquinone biosynthesis C-methylase UbiE